MRTAAVTVIARTVHLCIGNVEASPHDCGGGAARTVHDLFERIVIQQAPIECMDDAEKIDPSLVIEHQDFMKITHIKLASFLADHQCA